MVWTEFIAERKVRTEESCSQLCNKLAIFAQRLEKVKLATADGLLTNVGL